MLKIKPKKHKALLVLKKIAYYLYMFTTTLSMCILHSIDNFLFVGHYLAKTLIRTTFLDVFGIQWALFPFPEPKFTGEDT